VEPIVSSRGTPLFRGTQFEKHSLRLKEGETYSHTTCFFLNMWHTKISSSTLDPATP